jgi:two-component system CheB/CheR fusion protein
MAEKKPTRTPSRAGGKSRATPAATASATPGSGAFPIVGIGASAGGLAALEEFFGAMPADSGMAFVVVTHQHPDFPSLLPELLSKVSRLKVVAVRDGMKVEPDHVYVSTPGGYLALLGGTLHRMEGGAEESPRLPIDYFFRSLAEERKERAVCIILSGMDSDGALGLKAIKAEWGMAMVQQVRSAKHPEMPASAIATGLADYVLPPAEMPARLVAYAQGPCLAPPHDEAAAAETGQPLQKVFVLLRARTGHDFSSYKSSTIRRRVERRMNLHQLGGLADYVRFLQDNPHEIDILFKELLISVTHFFRDPEAFAVLAESALPALVESRPDHHGLRVWVPGCATGEEVYSLAILLRECVEAAKRHCEIQIFGTDLDQEAIETARHGRYPAGIAADVSPERLDRCFTRDDSGYRIRKEIRETAIFAVQNVIKDPPFTKLDLISCRNLLIYLNADLQRRLLPVFHYALKPGGLLVLGSSETIGGFTDLFEVIDKKWRIFRRKESAAAPHPLLDFPVHVLPPGHADHAPARSRAPRESNIARLVEQLLLARFAPSAVVVSDRGDVVYIHGRTGDFLEPAAGQPRLNILDMARDGLQLELAAALRQALAHNGEVLREDLRVRTRGEDVHFDLGVARILEPESLRGLLLVTFRPRPAEPPRPEGPARGQRDAGRIGELERELQCTRESLQTTIEELETANEELKSANEELQSTNEELQSTNEEMETSKEEMQSLNEELTTVNAEMQSKVEDLSRTNDDMQNLLNGTRIATLFLDQQLNIKRFTEQARHLVNLIQSDIGRPLADLVSSLAYDRLVPDCREVLRTLVFRVAEVQTRDGHWYLMRIMPYRTADNVIDGVVVTFLDIDPIKSAERSLLRMSKVFLEGPEPMMILDLEGRIVDLNHEAERSYGWSRQEMIGRSFTMTVAGPGKADAEAGLARCLAGEEVRDLDCLRITKAGRELPGSFTLKLLPDQNGRPDSLCLLSKHPAPPPP